MVAGTELPINRFASATQMAQEIFGAGVTINSASYTGDRDSSGIYTNGNAISPEVTPGDTGVMFSTGDLRGFTNNSSQSNLRTNTTTNSSGQNNNPDFNAAAGARTYDASYLDVDFTPTGNTMTMQFVFASEEYPEYASGAFQDFVGVWINGTQVDLGVGDGDIDPNNLNAGANQNLFRDNTNDQFNTEMDGFTVKLTLKIPVNAGVVNSIRIGIADVSDSNYDSTLLIAGNSIQTTLIANDDSTNLFPTGSKTIDVLANDVNNNTNGTMVITHINNQQVSVGDTVVLNTGQTVQLNFDGTLTLVGDGDTEQFNFTYEVSNQVGQTDTGFVLVDSVPCFVAGTMIRTPDGEVAVETLEPGDLVMTRDRGAQPLRWIGEREVPARGDFAPIHIAPNTLGRHGRLFLSPLHRVLIRDSLAALLFGEEEVLIAARDLVNDRTIRRVEGGRVTYVHLLFDQHEVVFSEGLETESFLPGPQFANSFEADIVREICTLFPEIDPDTGAGYSPAARRTLKRYEAALLAPALTRVA